MEKLTLFRDDSPGGGILVVIEKGARQGAWPVNIPREIEDAVGVSLGFPKSATSFALGLHDEGHRIVLAARLLGQPGGFVDYYPSSVFVPAYYILGRAWICEQWQVFKSLLQRDILPHRRLSVLESTARYYRGRVRDGRLPLIVSA